jgi:hypothetical protein
VCFVGLGLCMRQNDDVRYLYFGGVEGVSVVSGDVLHASRIYGHDLWVRIRAGEGRGG